MSFTLSLRSLLYLRKVVDDYRAGVICRDEFVSLVACSVRQRLNHLAKSKVFMRANDAAQHYHPAKGRPIYASTLVHAHDHRITLLGIPMNASIPLHDHPDGVSIVVFLSGRIYSPIYKVISKHHPHNLTELMSCSELTYTQGDIAVLTPDTSNLHSMEALSTEAVCLSIQLSILSGFSNQSYFFPAVPESTGGEHSLWHRIPFQRNHNSV